LDDRLQGSTSEDNCVAPHGVPEGLPLLGAMAGLALEFIDFQFDDLDWVAGQLARLTCEPLHGVGPLIGVDLGRAYCKHIDVTVSVGFAPCEGSKDCNGCRRWVQVACEIRESDKYRLANVREAVDELSRNVVSR
jgi:hypothetical protein